MKKPLFIVGTGRCGSTLLSNMVRQHPTCLSISEFFAAAVDLGFRLEPIFSQTPISGEEFWGLIATHCPRQDFMLNDGWVSPQLLYPIDGSCRYNKNTGLAPILFIMLPHLTEEPDALFDELHAWVFQRPTVSAIEHTQAMFQYLADRFGKTHWVERSGLTIVRVQQLLESFPEARFLHLVRDGRNCAISMNHHPTFRMMYIWNQQIQLLGIDPFEIDNRTDLGNLPDELRCLLPENLTPEAFWNYKISPSVFGHFWSEAIKLGVSVLGQLPQEKVLTLYYEDFLANPVSQVTALAEFVDGTALSTPEVEQWIQQSAAMVGKPRSSQWEDLPLQEREELHQACLPGFEVLQAYS